MFCPEKGYNYGESRKEHLFRIPPAMHTQGDIFLLCLSACLFVQLLHECVNVDIQDTARFDVWYSSVFAAVAQIVRRQACFLNCFANFNEFSHG